MGALASNRKRGGDEYFNSNCNHKNKATFSNSLDFQLSKKPRFSLMNQSPAKAILSSNNTVSRISRYPEAKLPFPTEVHAPVRHLKFGLSASNPNQDSVKSYMGNFLTRRLSNAKRQAFDALRYFKKEKEVIFVEDDEKEKMVSDDFSVEEVDVIEKGKNKVEEEERRFQPSSSSVVTELNNGSLRVENALDMLSLNREVSDLYDLEAYKK
ncbi:hypothetical protein CRYUN_Cryun10bG0016100 [Craigia yunnanensis]